MALRWVGLLAALLLCMCMIDSARPVAPAVVQPAEVAPVPLSIQLWQRLPDPSTSRPPAEPTHGANPTARSEGEKYRGPATVELFHKSGGSYPLVAKEELQEGRWEGEVPPGWYWVLIRAPGRARFSDLVEVRERRHFDFELLSAHELNIRVVHKQGEELSSLPDATVLVERPGELPFGGATSKRGEVEFSALTPGPWKVRVLAPGYEPYEAETESDLLIRLTPVMTLRVHVQAADHPVGRATVHIAGVSLWPSRAVQTGPKGYVDITGLRAGEYALYATEGSRASPVERGVKLLAQRGMNEVTLELEPGDFVLAHVHDAEGQSIPEARGTFSAHGPGQFMQHGEADENGLLRLGPFVEQEGNLLVRAPGFVSRVVPAALPGPQEVELIRAGVVTGRVIDDRGFPVEGATVEVVGTDVHGMPVAVTYQSAEVAEAHFEWAMTSQNVLVPAGELGVLLGPVPPIPLGTTATQVTGQLVTNAKGRFEVKGVPPGKLVVLGRHPQHLDGRSDDFQLAPGGTADVEVVLGAGVPLSGRVLDHRDFPVENARVRVSGRGYERIVAVETDGTFRLESAPKEVTLRVTDAQRPLLVLFERRVESNERNEEIVVQLPEPREPARLRIVDARGEPVGLAQVNTVSLEPSVPLRATRFSDEEGQVEFPESRGLRVRVTIAAPGFVEHKKEQVMTAEQAVSLTESLTAEGRVTAVRGRLPAAGAIVTLESGSTSARATADEAGNYVLEDLPPGPARLHAEHSEYGKADVTVQVRPGVAGRNASLPDLDLQPAGAVSGRVVDDRGFPVAGALVGTDRLAAYLPSGNVGPGVAVTDEDGQFSLEILQREGNPTLHVAAPGAGIGWLEGVELDARGEAAGLEVAVTEVDEAPAGELGTVLFSLVERGGVFEVYALPRKGAAYGSGVRVGDRLVSVDGYGFEDMEGARQLLSGTPGTDVALVVDRQRRRVELRTVREAFRRHLE